jgi:uncharacterized protein YegL
VFVVDSSGSIRGANPADKSFDNYNLLLTFITEIIDALPISLTQVKVGMVIFGNAAKSEFYLNSYQNKTLLKQAVLNATYLDENTNTSGAIREMHYNQFTVQRGHRPNVKKIAIIITDGKSTYDSERTIPEALAARADNITIVTVGITDQTNVTELQLMSSMPQQEGLNFFQSINFNTLNSVMTSIILSFCETASQSNVLSSMPGYCVLSHLIILV